MLYLALFFSLFVDNAKDIKVPPEFVNPWITPTIESIEILKKFILSLILSFNKTKKTEKIITIDTNNLKLMSSLKYFRINNPITIDGIHTTKNFFSPL